MSKSSLITLIFLSFVVPGISFAQTQEGAIFASGAATFNFNKVKEKIDNDTRRLGSLTTLELNPAVGFFIIDGIAAGVAMDWQRQAIKDTDNEKNVENSFAFGPFGRYYTALGPFFQAQFTLGSGYEKVVPDGGPEVKHRFGIFSWGLGIGYPYFLNEKVSLEPLFLYRSQNRSRETAGGVDEVTKYRGLTVRLGLVYYIFDR